MQCVFACTPCAFAGTIITLKYSEPVANGKFSRNRQEQKFVENLANRKVRQSSRMLEDNDFITGRTPYFLGRIAPENQTRQPDCGGEVRNARVVADEAGAVLKQVSQFGQWAALGNAKPRRRQSSRQALKSFAFSFALPRE